jgi:hypothetical protein
MLRAAVPYCGNASRLEGEILYICHLPFAFCHLNFELLFWHEQIKWQMAKVKWQM